MWARNMKEESFALEVRSREAQELPSGFGTK